MKTTERFEKAVTKLYSAFHKGTLDAFKCNACAVGNIVGHGNWSGYHSNDLSIGSFRKSSGNDMEYPQDAEYSESELQEIEYIFLSQWNAKRDKGLDMDKALQFKGLCAVIEYLCELDGIPNVMDYSSLFEYNEDNTPKKKLEEVI